MNVAEESMEGSVPEDTGTILEGVSLADDILVTKDDEITITGTTTVDKMDIDMLGNEMESAENKNVEDSSHVSTELILSEVKEQVLKEVEEMQNSEIPSLDASAVAAVDIENLLDSKSQESPKADTEPQIGLDDIKEAQNEIGSMDILVCGACHIVSHFIEAFQTHKETCKGVSTFHGNVAETKPQVWAFLLWKNAQKRFNIKGTSSPSESAWKLYQKWTKMPRNMRDSWVSAGETIMNFKSISSLNICDTLRAHGDKLDSEAAETPQNNFRTIGPASSKRNILNESLANFRNQLDDIDSSDRSINDADFEAEPTRISFPKFSGVKSTNNVQTTAPIQDEFVVEKIVSRRFNPRKKQYEYLLKWEGYPSEQNTWEPAENLEACQHLLHAFEESLSKQSKLSTKINLNTSPKKQDTPGPSGLNSIGRPVRYSKQKALNQVKAWCGSIKPDDNELESIKKRGLSDSEDEEDSMLKKIKLNADTDSEDSLGGRIYYNKPGGMTGIIKKSGRGRGGHRGGRIAHNGISNAENLASILGLESSGDEADGKKLAFDLLNKKSLENKVSSLSPANQQVNVLVANAKGVVKVDNAQVPNLASGVYIMSNKSGIIKLDSVSPSKALSLKQGQVKELSPSKNVTLNSGVVVLNKNQTPTGIQKTGILRKNSLNMSGKGENILQRSVGRPPKPAAHIKINNSTTRLLHSGAAAKASINATPTRPKLPLKTTLSPEIQKKPLEFERRVLGSKINRGGISGRGSFKSRGGHTGILNNSLNLKEKDVSEMPSSDSDQGIPDDFPADLPPIGPESPPRPLTLCPKTGKVLSKAEGERTPEPTPPPSPLIIKDDAISKVRQPKKKPTKMQNTKETIVRKTIGKPGSIGSVSISPKKEIPEVVPEDDQEYVDISGEDGIIYKILKSELNNTIVMGEDGQQCVYVTTENGEENAVILGGGEYSNVSQIEGVSVLEGEAEPGQFYIKQEGEVMAIEEAQAGGEQTEENASQLVAQLVEASGPAPGGGPRQVVLMLPDGSFVMTEVDEEQFAALEFDKVATAEVTESA